MDARFDRVGRFGCREQRGASWFARLLGVGALAALAATAVGHAEPPADTVAGDDLPTGKAITPAAAHGAIFLDLNPGHPNAPDVRASGAAAVAVSPDGKLLAIETNGYNEFYDRDGKSPPELKTDYLFLFDVSCGQPKQMQVLPIHTTFQGLAWSPASDRIFVSGGIDDAVQEFVRSGLTFEAGRTLKLGHKSWVGPDPKFWMEKGLENICQGCWGEAAGLGVSPDGKRLLVANIMNDSVSVIDVASGRVVAEQDLRPGIIDPRRRGESGGSYPRAVVWISPGHAYVASNRDREIVSLSIAKEKIGVVRRMPVDGQPVALLTNRAGTRLYAALDTTDQVAIFDTAGDKPIETLDVVTPENVYANARKLGGGNTNALALTPDERTLLVSNGGENAVAVVQLGDRARGANKRSKRDDDDAAGPDRSSVVGLVPTGWYPAGVTVSKDGATWYVVNGKSPTGPSSGWCKESDPAGKPCVSTVSDGGMALAEMATRLATVNQHLEQLEKAGFLTMPAPTALELARLTKQVARNNRFDQPDKNAADETLFSFLHDHIKHVIYIMKENRSYDQMLGDLGVGNGDPRFTMFGEKITPNHHAIARDFVDLDNTMVSGEGSYQGGAWTESAQTTDYNERNEPLAYVGRGPWDFDGSNRLMNMALATSAERRAEFPASPTDPDILPGIHDVDAPDGPGRAEGTGYIWDAALSKGLTVRNWGLSPNPAWWLKDYAPIAQGIRDPYGQKQRVFWASNASLIPYSDPYYPTFRPGYPDYWRVQEWKREFAGFVVQGTAPNLMLMWLGGDHMGNFDRAIDGVNTPETQVADNDYALGEIIEAVANSPFAKDTLIVSIEDDAWDSADHVDTHRTVALFAGPYIHQHAVVSTRYTTVSVVKTIEEILGIGPIGLNDALAQPMSDIFDPNQASWTYKAIVPDVLRSTRLPLPPPDHASIEYPTHSAAYWAKAMAGQDFSGPDRVGPASFNRALWRGLKGDTPYPVIERETGLATAR